MAELRITVQLHGMGWDSGPSEKVYKDLCAAIGALIANDSRFIGESGSSKTASVLIEGYDPIEKGLLIRNEGTGKKVSEKELRKVIGRDL